MLMGEEDTQHQSVLQSAPFMFGCLARALKDQTLTRGAVSNALATASLKPFLEHLSGQQLAWLQRHMQLTADTAPTEVKHDQGEGMTKVKAYRSCVTAPLSALQWCYTLM